MGFMDFTVYLFFFRDLSSTNFTHINTRDISKDELIQMYTKYLFLTNLKTHFTKLFYSI